MNLEDRLERLIVTAAAGEAAAAALATAGGDVDESAAVPDVEIMRGPLLGGSLIEILDTLSAAAAVGHIVRARTVHSDTDVTVQWQAAGRPFMDMAGDAAELVGSRAVELDQALAGGDPVQLFDLLQGVEFEITFAMRNSSGAGLIAPSTSYLQSQLGDGRWASLLQQLQGGISPALVLVQDAGDSVLICPGVIFAGPAADLRDVPIDRHEHRVSDHYRRERAKSHDDLPDPRSLIAYFCRNHQLLALKPGLLGAAASLCWYWLGRNGRVTPTEATAHFRGPRSFTISLVPKPRSDVAAEIELYSWATAATDPVRNDAVQQAIGFAVHNEADLIDAAAPVLRTAQSLLELAARGVVAEALASRRGAREAAIETARAAAGAARDVATKAVERSLALLIAVAVAIFANGQGLISVQGAGVIVVLSAVLAAVALLVALRVELPSGRGLLTAFNLDVDLYREALGPDDLRAIRGLSAVTTANGDLNRAERAARWVYGTVIFGILTVGFASLLVSR